MLTEQKIDEFIIHNWMIRDLGLKGKELLIYAMINHLPEKTFTGNLGFLADIINSTKQVISKNMISLEEKKLIKRKKGVINGVELYSYRINPLNSFSSKK